MHNTNWIKDAKEVIAIEVDAISRMVESLDDNFNRAIDLISQCKGKVVFCGMGKSGHICKKLAATFSSVGIPSFFLHPAEGAHGDLGMVEKSDIFICLSYSGESAELLYPLKYAARKNIPIISITGGSSSTLAQYSTIVLLTKISMEACPYNLAPTASTTAALVLGDALAIVAAQVKGYGRERFAEFHPAGSLGKRLRKVSEVMYPINHIPMVQEACTLKKLIPLMTNSEIRGVAGVVDQKGVLIGVVTDGDIRRSFEKENLNLEVEITAIMSSAPKKTLATDLVEQALATMESNKIDKLFVVNDFEKNEPIGIVHIQNILREKIF